jgi:hypothetical protein
MLPLDHVTVAGADLRRMQAALAKSGLRTIYGGAHHRGGTEMALAAFPDGTYLELIALDPNAHPSVAERHMWSRFLKGDAGPCAWAVRTDDLEAEMRRLRSAGIAVSSPVANGRQRPDGVRLQWETATPGAGVAGTFFPFLIRDLTARELRVSPPGAATSADFRGIARVVLAVANLDAALARYRNAFGLAGAIRHIDADFGAEVAVPQDAPIVLAQPLDTASWLYGRLEQFGEAPCAILLDAVDLDRYRAHTASHWFDLEIRWCDHAALGWRLGFTQSNPRG